MDISARGTLAVVFILVISNPATSQLHASVPGAWRGQTFQTSRIVKRSAQPNEIRVTCNSTVMTVYIKRSLVDRRVKPSDLKFVNQDCGGRSSGTSQIVLKSRYDECGFRAQEDEEDITFSNTITCHSESPRGDVITRHICDMQIEVKCKLPRHHVLDLFYNLRSPGAPLTFEEIGFGKFILEFLRYTDARFNQPFPDDAAPVSLREPLFYGINLTATTDISLFIEDCWSTPSADPLDRIKYDLIKDGCRSDDTLQMFSPYGNRFRAFSFEAFSFIGDYLQVYIHCEVIVCITGSLESRCSQGCPRRGRRRRRVSGRMQGPNSQPRIVSQILGPFQRDDLSMM